MSKKVIKNFSIYTIGNILPQVSAFFLLPVYTRYMTPEDFGIVNSMTVIQSVLGILFTLGTERSIYRLFYDYEDEESRRNFLGTLTIAITVISLAITGLVFLFNKPIENIYRNISFFPYYALSILTALSGVYANIPKAYFQVKEKAGVFIALSFAQFLLSNLFILWYVVANGESAYGMMKAYFHSSILLLPVYLLITYRIINFRFRTSILKNSLFFSLPMLPSLISAWVLNLTDRIFIEKYFTLADVGLYSISTKIGSIVLIVTAAFFRAYNPYFYRLASSGDQQKAKRELSKSIDLFICIIMIFCFAVAFVSKETIGILFDYRYREAYKIIPIIAFGYLISQANGILNLYFYQEKKTRAVMILMLISAIVNIIANFFLVPWMGSYGAAVSTVLSFLFLFVAQYSISRKYYFIPFNWKLIIQLFASMIILFSAFAFMSWTNLYLSLLLKSAILSIGLIWGWFKFKANIINNNSLTESIT